jgi:hypothetical protein
MIATQKMGRESISIASGRKPVPRRVFSPLRRRHAVLPDVGVNLGGGDGLMAQQGLDIHQCSFDR